jgi:hypothetical protein
MNLSNIPANLTLGDSATWNDLPFLAADNFTVLDSGTYSLRYELRGAGAPTTVNATAQGTGWTTSITPTISAALSAGTWFWAAILTATGVRLTVARGEINIMQDLSAIVSNTFDGRSIAEIALADAESALQNLTASGKRTKKYTIGTRNAEYYTAAELIVAISYWKVRVANERGAKAIANGLGDPKNLKVRFCR